MKIYIDFDRTLFDCDKFLEDFYTLINNYNINKEIFKKCQNQCIENGFNPYLILHEIEKVFSFDKKLYEDVDNLLHKTKEYLYPDSLSFLKYLKEKQYQVTILTKGNEKYQKEKIFHAGIDKYYGELITTMQHKGKLNLDYKNGIFIDDNPKEIKSIMKKSPKMIIRIKRKNERYSDILVDDNVVDVSSLQEIINKEII